MRSERLTSILQKLSRASADIEACAVISVDGLTMAAQMPHGLDEDRIGAMSAAMLSLGERTAKELARGEMEQVLVKGDKGYILMTNASKDSVLTVVANANARLGLVFFDVKLAAEEIGKVLS